MKKTLFINPFGIGDVLFTTPVIRSIKIAFPETKICYWCNERTEDILVNNPDIEKVFALSRGDLKKIYQKSRIEGIKKFFGLLSKIKKEHFDLAFDFSLDHRYGLMAKLSGIKKRIGFNYKNRGLFLTDKVKLEGYAAKHVVEYYLDLLKLINIAPASNCLTLAVTEENKAKVKDIFRHERINEKDLLIGIAPGAGASWGKDAFLKHWPAIKFAQLADKLIDNLGAKILILADESERAISESIVSAMKNKPVDLTGKTNLKDLAAVISNLKMLITNDGGPLHMAVSLGIKTVSMFGPVDPLIYGPYPLDKKHIVITKDISCRPCYKNFRMPVCPRKKECLNSISVDEVFAQIQK